MLSKGILQLSFLPQQYRAKPHLPRCSFFATINVDLSKAEIECFQSFGGWEVITLAAVLRHCRGTFASLGVYYNTYLSPCTDLHSTVPDRA